MTRFYYCAILVFVPGTALGCSTDSTNTWSPGDQDGAVPAETGIDAALLDAPGKETAPVACKPEKTVSSQTEVVALLGSNWPPGNVAGSSGLPVTDDLRAASALTLDANSIPLPTGCVPPSCGEHVRFYGESMPGVTLDSPDPQASYLFQSLKVDSGAAFRLRPLLQDNHPMNPSKVPIIEVVAPCSAPCSDSAQRCPGDTLCYTQGQDYCLKCEGRNPESCACVSSTGTRPDGELCIYSISGDQKKSGTCQAGECK